MDLRGNQSTYSRLRIRWNVVKPLTVRPKFLKLSNEQLNDEQIVWIELGGRLIDAIEDVVDARVIVNCPEGVSARFIGRDGRWFKFGISIAPIAMRRLQEGDQDIMFSIGKESTNLSISSDE